MIRGMKVADDSVASRDGYIVRCTPHHGGISVGFRLGAVAGDEDIRSTSARHHMGTNVSYGVIDDHASFSEPFDGHGALISQRRSR